MEEKNAVEDPFSKAAIEARFRDAEEYQWDNLDFYMYLLADGIDVNLVRKYMGDETADIMLNYCVYHGLI